MRKKKRRKLAVLFYFLIIFAAITTGISVGYVYRMVTVSQLREHILRPTKRTKGIAPLEEYGEAPVEEEEKKEKSAVEAFYEEVKGTEEAWKRYEERSVEITELQIEKQKVVRLIDEKEGEIVILEREIEIFIGQGNDKEVGQRRDKLMDLQLQLEGLQDELKRINRDLDRLLK